MAAAKVRVMARHPGSYILWLALRGAASKPKHLDAATVALPATIPPCSPTAAPPASRSLAHVKADEPVFDTLAKLEPACPDGENN
jgi:hypothetical protein